MFPENIHSPEQEMSEINVIRLNLGEDPKNCDQFTAVCTTNKIYYAGNKSRETAHKDHIPHDRIAHEASLADNKIIGAFVVCKENNNFRISGSGSFNSDINKKYIKRLIGEIMDLT